MISWLLEANGQHDILVVAFGSGCYWLLMHQEANYDHYWLLLELLDILVQ